jgi:hypothetical protein
VNEKYGANTLGKMMAFEWLGKYDAKSKSFIRGVIGRVDPTNSRINVKSDSCLVV